MEVEAKRDYREKAIDVEIPGIGEKVEGCHRRKTRTELRGFVIAGAATAGFPGDGTAGDEARLC